MKTENDKDRAESQARSQLAVLVELTTRLKHCQECEGTDENGDDCQAGAKGGDTWADSDEYHDQASALQAIEESPLDCQIVKTYKILLCTGGPAVRIVGQLDEDGEPLTVQLEYQDWGTPWTKLETTDSQNVSLMAYVGQFYFAE